MTCEWAEGYLSAYLDDALDPQLRKDVGAHIETCAHCQALAEEYRRNDQLLATLAPIAPSDICLPYLRPNLRMLRSGPIVI